MRLTAALAALIALAAGAQEPALEDLGHRLRWGLSAEVGSSVGRGAMTILGELRLGYQHTRRLAVFGIMGGGPTLLDGGGGGAQFDFGAVAEFNPVDWFYVGGGLLASWGTLAVMLRDSPGYTYFHDPPQGSFRPGIDLRLGFSFGTSRPPGFNRGGFNIGIHSQLMLHPAPTFVTTPPSGARSSSPYPPQLTFTPMLMLGYDSR